MTRLASDPTISKKITSPYPMDGADSPTITDTAGDRLKNQEAWRAIVDCPLIEWGLHPSRFRDDGLAPPSANAISVAGRVVSVLRNAGMEVPLRVVPNGEGGIVFEWSKGRFFMTVEVQDDGSVESASYIDNRLHTRQRLL